MVYSQIMDGVQPNRGWCIAKSWMVHFALLAHFFVQPALPKEILLIFLFVNGTINQSARLINKLTITKRQCS